MQGVYLLTVILLGAMLLNAAIQLVALTYGIKYYLKLNPNNSVNDSGDDSSNSSHFGRFFNFKKVCNARVSIRKEDLSDEILGSPEYLLMENSNKPGFFEVENIHEAKLESAANRHIFTENDFLFCIFTKEDAKGSNIKIGRIKELLTLTSFKLNRPTLILICGWLTDMTWPCNLMVIEAVLKSTHDVNFIVLDWHPISQSCYPSAVSNLPYVATIVADFILKLESELKYDIKDITLIGHSLGAHISGNVGAILRGRIETIIGLDPAGPFFLKKSKYNRLDPGDAKYVMVVHCNLGVVRLGTAIESGHVDFYPNGGEFQAGCFFKVKEITGACSHDRAFAYYAESLINNNFVGRRCSSYLWFNVGQCKNNPTLRMGGFPVEKGESGNYYLYTNSRPPFAKGYNNNVV